MNLVNSGLSAISAIGGVMKANAAKMASANYRDATAKSLSQYSTELLLRPTFAIEKELLNDSQMSTLVRTGMANYAGFYVVALSIDNTVDGVSVGKTVGKYSPTRDAKGEAFNLLGQTIATVATASYKPSVIDDIPTLSVLGFKSGMPTDIPDLPKSYREKIEVSTENKMSEADKKLFDTLGIASDVGDEMVKDRYSTNADVGNINKEINQLANLAVGQMLEVTISRDKATAKVNMMLKPEMKSISSAMLTQIAGISKQPKSVRERFNAFWSRETIHSAWDYLTCRDLAEARARNLVEDTTEYYEKTYKRNVNNKTAALLTGEFSVGTVANTWIISDHTLNKIQATIGARMDNKRARDKFMAESGAMTLIVYNTDYQRIFIYNHGLDSVSEISMSYLEKKQKSDQFDFDVFKLLSQGSAPII